MNKQEIHALFSKEFSALKNLFITFDYSIPDAKSSDEPFVANPGVYVFWHPKRGVIKVGRHLINSRKRALEHIRDDTGGLMKKLSADNSLRLLLFNVKDEQSKHWVAALEIFFEKRLKPEIRSKRLG